MEINKSALEAANKVQEDNQAKVEKVNEILDEDLNKEYIDNRKVTISLIHNYSNYRKTNIKVLGSKTEVIGSSITSSRVLASNKGEVEKYFPTIVGLSPNNPEFITRVKAWLNNIHLVVTGSDVILDTSFIYNTKRDYINFCKKESQIEREFDKVNRSDISQISKALKRKIEDLNALESEKYQYGRPVNVEDYLMYRHCLLYRDVAKDTAFINSDASLRFYIKDENKEAEKRKKLIEQKKKAIQNFIELNATTSKFNAVYIAIVVFKNESISSSLLKSSIEKENEVMEFVNSYPDKFNKLVADKNIITKAFIETLIVRGELIRSEYNQQISTAEGEFIGSNLNEAVAYFNNPDNKNIKAAYEAKLKMF